MATQKMILTHLDWKQYLEKGQNMSFYNHVTFSHISWCSKGNST